MSKLIEKLILKCLKPDTVSSIWLQKFLFDNWKRLEKKGMYSAVFLDVAQTFDRVWHKNILHKLRSHFADLFYQLLKSYLVVNTFALIKIHTGNWGWLKLMCHKEVYWDQFSISFILTMFPQHYIAQQPLLLMTWQP